MAQLWSPEEIAVLEKYYESSAWPIIHQELAKVSPTGKPRWVRNRQITDKANKLGFRRDRTTVVISKTIEEDFADSERAEQEKVKVLLKENRSLKTLLHQQKAEQDLVADLISASLAKIEPLKAPPFRKPPKKTRWRPQIMILALSDIQAGQVVKSTDVAGLSEYSWAEVKKRMTVLRDSVLEIAESMPDIPFTEFWINALGDWVEGEDIYIGQSRRIDKDLVDQTFDLAELACQELIVPLCQYFPKVRTNMVWGNHGRTGRKGTHSPRTNFDYICYRYLQARLANIENLDCFISESAFMALDCLGSTHLLMHGDSIKRYMQVPWYGLERAHAQLIQLMHLFINYLWLGHHHQAAVVDASVGKRIANGSWTGADELSVTKMHAGNQPKQVLCGFNETRGITFQFDVQLAPRKQLTPDKDGIYTPVYRDEKDW